MKNWYDCRVNYLTKKQQHWLGVDVRAARLLNHLAKEPGLSTSALARLAKVPRVTTLRVLCSLQKRSLVTRKKVAREVQWFALSAEELRNKTVDVLGVPPTDEKGVLGFRLPLSEVGALTVYRGLAEILASNKKLQLAHAGERVLAIEPNGVWKHFPQQEMAVWVDLNVEFQKNNLIIEMVTEEGFDTEIRHCASEQFSSSVYGLAKDIRVVRAGFLDSATEVLLFRDQALFIDWAHVVAVEIKNPSTVRVLRAMFRLLQASGRPYHVTR